MSGAIAGSESAVVAALRARFGPPDFAFLPGVRNATGMPRVVRTADALAMGLWPSRGLELHGFEVKVDRSDWLRELKEPAKAEEIARFCDRWWLAVSDAAIVRDGELPPTWGLLVPRGDALAVKVLAPVLMPEPITRRFLAALCRAVTEASWPAGTFEEAVRREVEVRARRVEERVSAEASREVERARDEVARLRSSVAVFEAAAGVRLGDWQADWPKIGAAVRLVREGGAVDLPRKLSYWRSEAIDLAAHIGRLLDAAREDAGQQQAVVEGKT